MPYKLLIVSHNFRREGAQLVASTLAIELTKVGFDIEIIGLGEGILSDELTKEGIMNSVVTMNEAVLKCTSDSYNHILVNTIMIHKLVALVTSSISTTPLTWLIHESDIHTLISSDKSIAETLQSGATTKCFKVAFVCQSAVSEYKTYLDNNGVSTLNLTYIHNGVNANYVRSFLSHRNGLRSQMNFRSTDLVLITAGTPKPRKGQLGIVKLLSKLKNPNLKLVIVGMGGPDQEYENLIKSESSLISESVVLVDRGPAEHVYKYLSAADVYVCNSVIESFPLAILEAMSLSLPVVSTNINGIPEQVCSGAQGILYDNEEQFESALRSLTDVVVREEMAKAASKRIDEKFDLNNMTTSWKNLLQLASAE